MIKKVTYSLVLNIESGTIMKELNQYISLIYLLHIAIIV